MNRIRFDEDQERLPVVGGTDRSLMCTSPGCGRRWTCDFGRRLCSEHDAARHTAHTSKGPAQQRAIGSMRSLREAVRPYSEPAEPDEEAA